MFLHSLCGPLAAVPHIGYPFLIKIRFMAYHENAAVILPKGAFKLRLGIHIQMIGRLIQKQDIAFPVYDPAKPYLCLFPAAQYLYLAFNVLGGQPAFC